jgi:hypothetical protein
LLVNCIFQKVFNDVNIQRNARKNTPSYFAMVFFCTANKFNNKFVFEMNEYQQQGNMQKQTKPTLGKHMYLEFK